MVGKLRFGKLSFAGDNPMSFEELEGDPPQEFTPEQDALASRVAAAFKAYLETTESLSAGKYAHLRDRCPDYLANPGNLLVAICTDGIVVRYEKKSQETRRRGVAVFPHSITEVASLLSQNLIHIETEGTPLPVIEHFGVELRLFVHSPGDSAKDIAATRIWFQARRLATRGSQAVGAKPYCVLSVRNQLEFEVHGEMLNEDGTGAVQPFIARAPFRLLAGWDCIEVYPGLALDHWDADTAPLWAEHDILGAILIAQNTDAQLCSLDPRASTRRLYAGLLNSFKALLDSNPDREQLLQSFLQQHPVVLCPTHVRMWSKLRFGATISDFVFRDASNDYLLVELERSTLPLFREDGHLTAHLTHAHGQIVDWKRYIEDNLNTVQKELGLTGITSNPYGLLVIGRSNTLRPQDRRKLQTMASESPKLRIMTCDDVYENAKAVFENILGPLCDPGGATRVYYPTGNLQS